MSQPQYQVFDIDLTILRSAPGEQIVGVGAEITSVVVLSVPVGANVTYRFGDNGAPIQFGESPSFDVCPPATEGLRVTNPVGAGIARILVGYSDGLTPAS